MNTTSLEILAQVFKPPLNPSHPVRPDDFSHYHLAIPPDTHLMELFRLYGTGTFQCSEGDPITLHLPTIANARECEDVSDAFESSISSGLIEPDNFTMGTKLFSSRLKERQCDLILWGTSLNGVFLFSVWLGSVVGWATMVVDRSPSHVAFYFKSPAALLHDIFFQDSVVSGIFPKFSSPYRFEPLG